MPTLELRASIVIGSGSASYEAVRAVVELLPIVIAPRWAETATQPIAVEDVVDYLLAASQLEHPLNAVVEIGGRDRTTYAGLMREYARQRGLRRTVLPTSLATARLSRLVPEPRDAGVRTGRRDHGRQHAQRDHRAQRPRARAVRHPADAAWARRSSAHFANEDREFAETRWSDALPDRRRPVGRRRRGSPARVHPLAPVDAPAGDPFAPIQRIGGPTGWYHANWFWRLRGLLDTASGGVGLRRGRRDPYDLRVGDTVDFWRVERLEPGRLLRLARRDEDPRAAVAAVRGRPRTRRRPGAADDDLRPRGCVGLAYWYALYPLHRRVFAGMLAGIGRAIGPSDAGDRLPAQRLARPCYGERGGVHEDAARGQGSPLPSTSTGKARAMASNRYRPSEPRLAPAARSRGDADARTRGPRPPRAGWVQTTGRLAATRPIDDHQEIR